MFGDLLDLLVSAKMLPPAQQWSEPRPNFNIAYESTVVFTPGRVDDTWSKSMNAIILSRMRTDMVLR